MATFPTAILAGGYAVVALTVARTPERPEWARILALALAPLFAAPLIWAHVVYRPYWRPGVRRL